MLIKSKICGKYGIWVLVMLVCFLFSGALASAYGPWQPDNDSLVIQDLDELLEQLGAMVDRAKTARAAHPEFLNDLEKMILQLKAQRDVIAETCLLAGADQGYSQPIEIVGPDVRFLGFAEDRVGTWTAGLDGKKDASFQVLVYFPSKVEVKNITLHTSNSQGVKGSSYWFSNTTASWILGVFRNGKMLNPNREPSLGTFDGWVLFDIYVTDNGSILKDRYFLLELTTHGQVLKKLFVLGDPEQRFDRL